MIFGNDSSAKAVMESIDKIREKKDTALLGSGCIFQSMNSTVNMNLSTIFKIKGINYTISAFIHLAWLGLVGSMLWIATIICVAYFVIVFKYV